MIFTIGKSDDTFHFKSNYSSNEIEQIYNKVVKTIGFDIIRNEFNSDSYINENLTELLLNLGIINNKSWIIKHNKLYINNPYDFIRLFIRLIKIEVPDFQFYEDIYGYPILDILDDKGCGINNK